MKLKENLSHFYCLQDLFISSGVVNKMLLPYNIRNRMHFMSISIHPSDLDVSNLYASIEV